ncbi:MAG: T9SS type A sorting domain-containing protein [Bacteroidales bacterium]
MKTSILSGRYLIALVVVFLWPFLLFGQNSSRRAMPGVYPQPARMHDSVLAVRLPLLHLPEMYRNRSLPAVVDNSKNEYWPGIKDQYIFFTCQQFCGVAYVYGYEINRLRNQPGWYWENSYPAHYTWNFMNQGKRYVGANYLQSFEVIRQQGHMTSNDFGLDTVASFLGWISGYDKYYRGMFNHLKQVSAIEVNSAAGINTLKNYLFDHLNGSPTGGIACFSTNSATLNNMPTLPAGTPEEGKNVIIAWLTDPVHGMTVVGYNDSIRYDVNGDGKYTNEVDINGDGVVDARDWEIGGFRIANSYGSWWSNEGFVYALYRSFALNYTEGGVWNNRVYVLDADTGYRPLLTMKVKLTHDSRDKIRILAGVSSDTSRQEPDHVIDFPIFNYQGGPLVMQGIDSLPDAGTIEFGLDATPLLNFVSSNRPARYFLMIDERDPSDLGQGTIQQASFINYQNEPREFALTNENVVIKNNGLTLISVVAALEKPVVQITTGSLPPATPGQPYQVRLEASGGKQPYDWSIPGNYTKLPSLGTMPAITGTSVFSTQEYISYTAVALPFSFPFYGKRYDSLYINNYGFVSFDSQYLPEPYLTDEMNMLEMFPSIAPSFSQEYAYLLYGKNDGIWYQADATHAIIRWKASVMNYQSSSVDDFALILYPGGQFEFRYGTMNNQGFQHKFFAGVSKGDNQNFMLETQWNANELSGKSFRFLPPVMPSGLTLGGDGLLAVSQADSSRIYDLPVRVTDAGKMTDDKLLMLSNGLEIAHELMCTTGNKLEFGLPSCMRLVLTNTGSQPLHNLTVRISSADSLVQITDSLLAVPLLQPGVPLSFPTAFSFGLTNILPNNFPVGFTLHVQSGEKHWEKAVEFTVAAPEMVIESPGIRDGDDDILDPGEVGDLVVIVKNLSEKMAQNQRLKLTSTGSMISILSSPEISIDHFNGHSSGEFRFQIKASRDALPGSIIPFQILLNDSTGIIKMLDFSVPVGIKQVALVNLASEVASAKAMAKVLDSLHVSFDTLSSLQFDFNRYGSIFLILGTANSGSHTLKESEGVILADYLKRGGNLYIEGYFTWYYVNTISLHPMLKYATRKVPVYYYPRVIGVHGTLADSMSYAYSAPLKYAIFTLEPVPPAYSTLVNTDNPAMSLETVYDGDDYKIIATMLDFSALGGVSPPSSQTILMQRYLDFFDLNTTGPYPYFHPAQNAVCRNSSLVFTDDSYDHITTRNWEFEGGTPAASNEQNPVVTYAEAGTFDVKLTVSDGVHVKSVLKENYITVGDCSNVREATIPPFRIYPNPASGTVTVDFSRKTTDECHIRIFDLAGHQVMDTRKTVPSGNRISLDVSLLGRGFYFLSVQAGEMNATLKLIRD